MLHIFKKPTTIVEVQLKPDLVADILYNIHLKKTTEREKSRLSTSGQYLTGSSVDQTLGNHDTTTFVSTQPNFTFKNKFFNYIEKYHSQKQQQMSSSDVLTMLDYFNISYFLINMQDKNGLDHDNLGTKTITKINLKYCQADVYYNFSTSTSSSTTNNRLETVGLVNVKSDNLDPIGNHQFAETW